MHNFFAYMARMKLIKRWSLMKSNDRENIAEHSAQTAQIAHALAVIKNRLFDGDVNADRITTLALYHEAAEVITGDLPTPIKYFNPAIRSAFKDIESLAEEKLLSMIPDELQADYRPVIAQEEDCYEHVLVKAADKISAYIKCIEELRAGNREFAKAKDSLKKEVEAYYTYPEVKYFCNNFLPSFHMTLDELD